ncbi:MAG: 4Fe-4S dicluster domain-containing protein [Candidatus Aminicenantes bacterium]|nr:4Fe-4S dicluster domain-containing protein [Candidatus Aminicenantes bacterium]
MRIEKESDGQKLENTLRLKTMAKGLGVDLVGVVDLKSLDGMPLGIPSLPEGFIDKHRYAFLMGVQLGKFGPKTTGAQSSLFLEEVAFRVKDYLEENEHTSFIIHTEDEFDRDNRIGFMSLKVLAKEAGLGWQGRSLLIVSPQFGPIHRLIAVLTNLELEPDKPISNMCGDCSLCVDACPYMALTLRDFNDHPSQRSDVLDIGACQGDFGCMICLLACPYVKK